MRRIAARTIAILLVSLLTGVCSTKADPQPETFDSDQYQWAYGRVVDSIVVVGNTKVKTIAILREMETRVGEPLDRVALERDQRYIGDLSPFASVEVTVEPVDDDACKLRIVVTERSTLLLRLVYPVLDYDINTERLIYGLKWKDRNFRKRLENLSVDAVRDNSNNDAAAIQWNTAWIGWNHVGVGGRLSYYNRGETVSEPAIVEQSRASFSVSLPLTSSRIKFSQLLWGLSLADNRVASPYQDTVDEILAGPSIGYRYDDRDSPLKPRYGHFFYVNLLTNRVVNGEGSTYYRIDNQLRAFRPLDEATVIAFYSNISVQLGTYPDYIRFGLGGPGTVRGYERSDFRSVNRWVQTAEMRFYPWPKRFYKLPFVGVSDFTMAMVTFVDGGIGWSRTSEFNADNYHVGFGFGFRLYSPFQDVLRFDLGFNRTGKVRPYFSTGVRF